MRFFHKKYKGSVPAHAAEASDERDLTPQRLMQQHGMQISARQPHSTQTELGIRTKKRLRIGKADTLQLFARGRRGGCTSARGGLRVKRFLRLAEQDLREDPVVPGTFVVGYRAPFTLEPALHNRPPCFE